MPAWSAGWVNTYIKNNFATGIPDLMTTKGDIVAATAANAAARVAVGANGSVLIANSSATAGVSWAGFGVVREKTTATGVVPDLYAWSGAITFATEDYDVGGNWTAATFTAGATGYYLVTAMMQIGVDAGGDFDVTDRWEIGVFVDGALYSYIGACVWVAASGTVIMSANGADVVYMAKDSTLNFQVRIYQTGTETYTFNPDADATMCHVSVTYLK